MNHTTRQLLAVTTAVLAGCTTLLAQNEPRRSTLQQRFGGSLFNRDRKPQEEARPAQPSRPASSNAVHVRPAQPSRPASSNAVHVRPAQPSSPIEKPGTAVRPSQPARPIEKPGTIVRPSQPARPIEKPGTGIKPPHPSRPSDRPTIDFRPGNDHRPDVRPRPDNRPDHRPVYRPGNDHRPDVRPRPDHRPDYRPGNNHKPDYRPGPDHRPDYRPGHDYRSDRRHYRTFPHRHPSSRFSLFWYAPPDNAPYYAIDAYNIYECRNCHKVEYSPIVPNVEACPALPGYSHSLQLLGRYGQLAFSCTTCGVTISSAAIPNIGYCGTGYHTWTQLLTY